MSQVNAATHESELPNPPTNRASTSTHAASARPKARLVADMRMSPVSAAALTPDREARRAPGAEPTSTPAPNAPLRIPTADFERPNSSLKYGTSGVSVP